MLLIGCTSTFAARKPGAIWPILMRCIPPFAGRFRHLKRNVHQGDPLAFGAGNRPERESKGFGPKPFNT